MQGLVEKILADILGLEKVLIPDTMQLMVDMDEVEKIIGKHLSRENGSEITGLSRDNDGWISVEERLPNGGIDVEVTVRRGYRTIGYYNELYEEWYSTDESGLIDVIAWKEPSEPYRPEKSEEE